MTSRPSLDGDPDEFELAEATDHDLDLADDHRAWEMDWLELHGESLVHPTFAEALEQEGRARRASAERSARALRRVSERAEWSDDEERR